MNRFRGKPQYYSEQYRRIEGSFEQLRKQFDEKEQVLHHTRTELFRIEGKLFVKEREEENQQCELDPQEEKLVAEFHDLEEEKEELEKENLLLQDIIQILNEKLQPSPTLLPQKKKKKESSKDGQISLYGGDPRLIPDVGLGFHERTQ